MQSVPSVPDRQRTISPEARRAIVGRRLWAIPVFLLMLWGFYLFVGVFGFRPRKFDLGDSHWPYFALACVGTVAVIIWLVRDMRKAVYLAEYGLEVDGQVVGIGKISVQGLRHFEIAYVINDETYRHKISESKATVKEYKVGDVVSLMVDPLNRNRWDYRDSVIPKTNTIW